jgi:multidrug efflux pump subunit AcrA (membrane-fusion protein)
VVQQEASLLIPNQAIRVEDGVQVVYQLNDQGTLEAVPVVLGFSSNTSSELLDSILVEGDEIVLNPSLVLNSAGELSIEQLQELNQDTGGGPPALFGGGQ